jgi:alpha-L-fucosidase
MFIHWGVYAVPAGTYKGNQVKGIGEWIMNRGKIPMEEYREFAKQFNPVKYDPEKWVALAKAAGMRYIVITSKHHDGFTLFPSAATNWGIGITPYEKDLLKPLAEACRKNGIKLGFYYSQAQDWNNGGAAAGGKWDKAQERDMTEYIDQVAVPQVKEILSNYGEFPAVIWWDTPMNMSTTNAAKLIELLKSKPGIIHNNRLGGGFKGDTETPEQHIPATGFKDRDWETCMTMNDTWGFKSYDNNWKPVEKLLQNLIDIASKGGNYLLNVGPTAEGEFPQPIIERLEAIGKWMDVNGDAIHGTTASPFARLPWGRCTKKVTESGGTLFLHVFDWPKDGKIEVPGLNSKVTGAKFLSDGTRVDYDQSKKGLYLKVPFAAPDPIASVIAVEFTGALDVAKVLPGPDAKGVIELGAGEAFINNHLGSDAKVEGDHIGYWISPKVTVDWNFTVQAPGEYRVELQVAGEAESQFTVSSGKEKLRAKVAATGDYNKFKKVNLGNLKISEAGEVKLTIAPDAAKWKPLNVRGLTLSPVK